MQTSQQLTKSSRLFLFIFFTLKLGVVNVLHDVDDADVAAVIPLTTSTTTSVAFPPPLLIFIAIFTLQKFSPFCHPPRFSTRTSFLMHSPLSLSLTLSMNKFPATEFATLAKILIVPPQNVTEISKFSSFVSFFFHPKSTSLHL